MGKVSEFKNGKNKGELSKEYSKKITGKISEKFKKSPSESNKNSE